MIAKMIKGTSFSGVLAYILGKQEGNARILHAESHLEGYALRYRAIRMKLGQSEPKITELDSLFSSEDSDDSIRRLRPRVTNYELSIQRQAELQLQQRRINEEQEVILQNLMKE